MRGTLRGRLRGSLSFARSPLWRCVGLGGKVGRPWSGRLEGKAPPVEFKAARMAGRTGRWGEAEPGGNGRGLGLSQGRGERLRRECSGRPAAEAGVGLLEGSGRVGRLPSAGPGPRSDDDKADASLTLRLRNEGRSRTVCRPRGREIGNGSKAAERIGEMRRE